MARDTLRVIAGRKARPGKVNEFLSVRRGLIESTRKEPGCIQDTLPQNNEDPTGFTLIDEVQDNKALESHFATKHFKDTLNRISSKVAISTGSLPR
jgi:quinol monooxygenase YgiN